jgi:DNA-binding NarL/FixJ family response regulator
MPKTKVLIVDDHWVVIEGIKSALSGHPEFEVVGEAFSGYRAVNQAISLKPDIIIMDISIPDLNGLEATRKIRAVDPDIHIIIFSMHSEEQYIIKLFKTGISGYILKEDSLSELILAIEAAKVGGTYLSASCPTVLLNHLEDPEGTKCDEENFGSLSMRECQVLKLLAQGKTIKAIASQLYISPKTVESHKYNIMSKLSVHTLADLTKIAIRKQLISL